MSFAFLLLTSFMVSLVLWYLCYTSLFKILGKKYLRLKGDVVTPTTSSESAEPVSPNTDTVSERCVVK